MQISTSFSLTVGFASDAAAAAAASNNDNDNVDATTSVYN